MFRYHPTLPSHHQCKTLLEIIQSGREHLPGLGRKLEVAEGEVIYDYGDIVDNLYLVESGRVRTSVLSSEGRELVTGIHGPGDMFGQFCMCQQHVRNERAAVIEAGEVVRLGVQELLDLAATGTGALAMLQLFCRRISDLEEQVAQLAFHKVRTRLGMLLLRLAEEGEPQDDGSFLCYDSPTHEEMASRIGTTREQVSTLLAQFRRKGAVSYQRTGPLRIYPKLLREQLEEE
ncbi:MAG: Crp/Fnr family transcriptional regulator [Firmicutes bacterium]|nr:Crp/Fnr family transcriptional regulator [Bacillota bacterium]